MAQYPNVVIAPPNKTLLNVTAPVVIKPASGRLVRVIIIAPGTTSGAFTFNDCLTLAGANATNAIWTLPFGGTGNVAGASFALEIPVSLGLVLSAVPGAGAPILAVVYY